MKKLKPLLIISLLYLVLNNFLSAQTNPNSNESNPSGRYGSASWLDKDGNLWLFGGNGIDKSSSLGLLNDFWMLDSKTNNWIFIGGSLLKGQKGNYGSIGIADKNNFPGGRAYATTWIAKDGNLILFGGYGVDATGNIGSLNDMWKYDIKKSCWIWIKGNNFKNPASQTIK